MKNKNITYLLIVVVLLVWGTIIYRIVNASGSDTPIVLSDNNTEILIARADEQPASFSLKLNYRDPFLGTVTVSKSKSKTNIAPKVQKVEPVINWPNVTYGGLIKNDNQNVKLAFVAVNGRSSIMKVGDSFLEVKLLANYGDSIQVEFENQKRFIKK